MKKNINIIFCALILTFSLNAQPSKGSLLLEGQLNGPWTEISLNNPYVFGIYLSDNFALTIGTQIGIIEDESMIAIVGTRIHFTESTLLYTDIKFDEELIDGLDVGMGIGNRFYANEWLAFEPRAGLRYIGDVLQFYTAIGVSVSFYQL